MAVTDRLGRPLRDSPFRGNCRVVAVANLTLSGLQTIDGVTVETGDRVLATGQSTGAENGVYVAQTGAWERARDLSVADDFLGTILVSVEEGTTYQDTIWRARPSGAVTVGSTTITFTVTTGFGDAVTEASFDYNGLQFWDTNASHRMRVVYNSNLTSDRDFTLTTGDAARSVNFGGDFSITGNFSTAAALAFSGAHATTFTLTAPTTVTFPTTGTLATTDTAQVFTSSTGLMASNNSGGVLTLVDSDATSGQRTLRLTTVAGLSYLQVLADDLLSGTSIFTVNHSSTHFYWGTSATPIATEVNGVAVYQTGQIQMSTTAAAALSIARRTSDGQAVTFYRQTSEVGSISVTGSATAFNTSSDGRLKTDRRPYTASGSVIDATEVYDFAWPDGSRGVGVIAQDAQTVHPVAVTPGDTPDDIWSVDYSKYVPVLLAELKALRARVAELEQA